MADSTRHYPLSIESVKKIKDQNKQGIKPAALETVEIISEKPKEVEPEFVDVVGQITLKALEKNSRKRKNGDRTSDNNRNGPRNNQPQKNEQKQAGNTNRRSNNKNPRNNRNNPKK